MADSTWPQRLQSTVAVIRKLYEPTHMQRATVVMHGQMQGQQGSRRSCSDAGCREQHLGSGLSLGSTAVCAIECRILFAKEVKRATGSRNLGQHVAVLTRLNSRTVGEREVALGYLDSGLAGSRTCGLQRKQGRGPLGEIPCSNEQKTLRIATPYCFYQ